MSGQCRRGQCRPDMMPAGGDDARLLSTAKVSSPDRHGDGPAPDGLGREETGSAWARRWSLAWPWLVGCVLAVVVLGPALGRGNLFLLDADFVPRYPVPSGVWGLGPAIPRRVPLGLLMAWTSVPLGGALAAKLVLGGLVVLAFVGAGRVVSEMGWLARLGAGALYALSPFALTRLGAGQWNVLAAYAVLPWVLAVLLSPGKRPARTFLAALAMAATGSVGGIFAGLAVGVGLLAERDRAALRGAALALIAQAPWLVPGLVVVSGGGTKLASSTAFPTQARGLVGELGLFAGHGFWRSASQVGGQADLGVAVLGGILLALAILGAGSLPRQWRWRAVVLACVGVVLSLASALPWTRGAYQAVTSTIVGSPFREGGRNMALTLVWMAPAAAGGARRLGGVRQLAGERGRLTPAALSTVPVLVALVLAIPGLWGVGGRLTPVKIPRSWGIARAAVHRAPGPVLALPFYYHLPLNLVGGREVLNPLPDELGGDVISSSNLDAGVPDHEAADPRVGALRRVMAAARGAEPVATSLARAGVRWVALLHSADWRAYSSLASDPGLVQVVHGSDLQLFEVRAWAGPVLDSQGHVVALRTLAAPLGVLAPSGPATWDAPGAPGWMRGSAPAGVSPLGLVSLPAGEGLVWYWPALVVLGADLATLAVALVAWRSLRHRPSESPLPDAGTYDLYAESR